MRVKLDSSKDIKINPIKKWDGKATTLRHFRIDCSNHFIMQPNRYDTEQKKVTAACMACMGGHAEPWACTILEGNRSDLEANYQYFMAELEANFDDPNIREEYVNRLQNLKQTTSVVLYAADFEAVIYHTGYGDGWADRFYSGLKLDIKQQFVSWLGDRQDYKAVKQAAINFDSRLQTLQ